MMCTGWEKKKIKEEKEKDESDLSSKVALIWIRLAYSGTVQILRNNNIKESGVA